jgi:hypothetical protein
LKRRRAVSGITGLLHFFTIIVLILVVFIIVFVVIIPGIGQAVADEVGRGGR